MENKTLVRAGIAIGCVVGLVLIAPLIWMAVSAGIGLAVLGVIGLAGFAFIQAIPYMGQKIENAILKARKSEASNNPIEQLQNFLKQKADRVAEFKSAVASIGAQIMSLESALQQRKRERPSYDYSTQENQVSAMRGAHAKMKAKYVNADAALVELRQAIQDKEFEWKFSQAGQAAMKALNAASGEELMEQMLADTAFASVTDNFNRVFAELEMEATHLTESKQLEYGSGMTIDVSSINLSHVKV